MHVGQKYRQEKNKDVKESANDVAPATFGTWTTTSPTSAPRVIASLAKTAKPACLRTNARNAKPSCTPMSETDVSTRETHRSIEQQMQHNSAVTSLPYEPARLSIYCTRTAVHTVGKQCNPALQTDKSTVAHKDANTGSL